MTTRCRVSAFAAVAALLLPPIQAHGQDKARPSFCDIASKGEGILKVRPADTVEDPPLRSVNWFARPIADLGRPGAPVRPHVIGFASFNHNWLYDLDTGLRARLPDQSDAVVTPDGRLLTIPAHYTLINQSGTGEDGNKAHEVRFYDMHRIWKEIDEQTKKGVKPYPDASGVPPVLVQSKNTVQPDLGLGNELAGLSDVYYQSVGILPRRPTDPPGAVVYRVMYSGALDANYVFKVNDYTFVYGQDGEILSARAGTPMPICREVLTPGARTPIIHDHATPMMSKDGRYFAAYSSPIPNYTGLQPTLKLYRMEDGNPSRCRVVFDFMFPAGKVDFDFTNDHVAFHVSKEAYLQVYVNNGIDQNSISDVVIMDLKKEGGEITGYKGLRRLTTAQKEGLGHYFPAYFPDGKLFYISNDMANPYRYGDGDYYDVNPPAEEGRKFHFTLVDPSMQPSLPNVFANDERKKTAAAIARLWANKCGQFVERPLQDHEAPWWFASLGKKQCEALVADQTGPERGQMRALCGLLPR